MSRELYVVHVCVNLAFLGNIHLEYVPGTLLSKLLAWVCS